MLVHLHTNFNNTFMGSIVFQYIVDNWPTFAIIIIVSITCYRITRKFTKWEDKHNNMHNENDKVHDDLISLVNKALSKIDTLERFLIKRGGAEYDEFTRMNSPRQLNEKGRKLFNESGAKDFFENNKNALLRLLNSEISEMRNKTALDVDSCALRVCFSVSNNKSFKKIKDFVYTHPIFEGTNITINTIAMLMGIELRNEYLKLHPDIDPMSE